MVQLTDRTFAVPLTNLGDTFKNLRILPADNKWAVPYLLYSYRSIFHTERFEKDFYCGDEIPLRDGSWKLLFTTKEATEEDARKVVESIEGGWFKSYEDDNVYLSTAAYSLQSLLKSNGCDVNKNWAIIQKL